MKKHTAGETKAKHASPTKRKWNTKVADILGKTLDRYEVNKEDKSQDASGRPSLQHEAVESLLKQVEGLAEVSDVDNLIEEASILNIPSHNDNLKKLHELKEIVGQIHKEVEKFNEKKADHKLSKYISVLNKITNLGASPANVESVISFVKRNYEILRSIQQAVSVSSLDSLLEETEKRPKLYDQDLLEQLSKKRDRFGKAMTLADSILKSPQFTMIDENALSKLIAEVKEHQFDFDSYSRLESLSSLISSIRHLSPVLFPNEMFDELSRQEELSDAIQRFTFRLGDMLDAEVDEETIVSLREKSVEIRELLKRINFDDLEITGLLAKLDGVVWRHEAKEILEKNEDNEEELVKLLHETPKNVIIEGCREYSQIKERVHAIQAAQSNEQRIAERLEAYWEDEQIHLKTTEIKAFVEETKSYILKKKVERKLEVLEQVSVALQNVSSAKNKEDLVDEMCDLKLQNTKVFQRLSAIAKSSEKAEKNVGWVRQNKKKFQKYRESSLTPTVRALLEMPKMKVSQAKEILTFLKGLPQALRVEYESDYKSLEGEINSLATFGQEAESLLKQYPRQKFLDMKLSSGEVRACMEKLRSVVKKLFESNYKDENIETKLSELDLLVKGACLLDRSVDSSLKRDISTWESTLKALREWSKDDQKNSLMREIKAKMDKAERIMMEVHRMRQYESQFAQAGSKVVSNKIVSTRQNRMPTVEEAKALLRSYQEECEEIELEDTCGYLKTLVEGCEERVAHSASNECAIGELQVAQEQLRKTPLNVEGVLAEIGEKVQRAQEFLKKVKGMSSESLSNEMESLKNEYSRLGVKVQEFEKLSEQFYAELEKTRGAEAHLERMNLQQATRARQEIMGQSFFRDRSLETKLLMRQVQLLEDEFARRNDGYEDDSDAPVIDFSSLETVQKELLEVRKNSRINYSNKGQFLSKLVTDVKSYLQENIYSLGLEGVGRLRSYSYRKLVDLTKEITDHKIKLEISQKPSEKDKLMKRREAEENRKYDAFGLFGTEFALISKGENYEDPRFHFQNVDDQSQAGGKEKLEAGALSVDGDKKDSILKKKRLPESPFQDPKKPDISHGTITPGLRQYYSNGIKTLLEKNESFEISGLDALMAANTLERQIYDKYIDKLKEYDDTCENVCKVLRNLIPMDSLSVHIRNKGFRLSILIKLIDKDRLEMKKIDEFAKQKLDRNKGQRSDQEVRVVDEEDELLENAGEGKDKEEANLHFSDLESDGANEDPAVTDIQAVVPRGSSKGPRALCYDPETGQYQVSKNKFINPNSHTDYTFYNIFKGGVHFETKEKIDVKKKPEKAKMFSCTGEGFIKYFSELPEGIQISAQLSRYEFDQYIQKVLVSDQALNYLVLPLWIETSTPLTYKNFYKSNECVGSVQYSPKCKLFIFPKEYLRQEWLNVINFFFVKKDLALNELVGFIVLKLANSDSYEVSIIPEPVKVEKSHRAYKFARSHNDVVEKIIDIELLKENKNVEDVEPSPPKASSRFFEDIIEFPEDDKKNPNKKMFKNKLQRLMANELSTTQSPSKATQFKESMYNMETDQFGSAQFGGVAAGVPGGQFRPSARKEFGQSQFGGFGQSQMGSTMGGPQFRDDLDSQDGNMSRFSDDFDNPALGKRMIQPQRAGMGVAAVPQMHQQHGAPDFQRSNPGFKPRGGQMQTGRMDSQAYGQPQTYGQPQIQMGAPNKMVKRDFGQGQGQGQRPGMNTGHMQPHGKSQFGYGGGQNTGGFDMGEMDVPPQAQTGGYKMGGQYGGGRGNQYQGGGGGFGGGRGGGFGSQGSQMHSGGHQGQGRQMGGGRGGHQGGFSTNKYGGGQGGQSGGGGMGGRVGFNEVWDNKGIKDTAKEGFMEAWDSNAEAVGSDLPRWLSRTRVLRTGISRRQPRIRGE